MSEESELEYELDACGKVLTRFTEAMKLKLELRAGSYGSYRKYSFESLRKHLLSEFRELVSSNFNAEECIDVANMCCLLWDKRLEPLRKASED